jgi:hypothetical protein
MTVSDPKRTHRPAQLTRAENRLTNNTAGVIT